ncbi:MAG: potassium channel family protein [Microlunatus sp.]|nr:potassium channel family protein [Microlunatus sp.]
MPESPDGRAHDDLVIEAGPPRRTLLVALLRSLVSVSVVVASYFWLPLSHRSESFSLAELVGGLVLVGVALAIQFRAIVRSPYPLMKAVEALCITGPLFIVVFSVLHFEIGSVQAGSYSQPMTRLDALYFTMTTFATVGYGDISPVSQPARVVALLQMVLGLILVGVVARVITGAAQLGVRRREGRSKTST